MADIYELSVALDLRADLSDEESAELRWHLGLGPRPVTLTIVRAFPVVVEDDEGEPVIEDDPVPLLGCHDAALRARPVAVTSPPAELSASAGSGSTRRKGRSP